MKEITQKFNTNFSAFFKYRYYDGQSSLYVIIYSLLQQQMSFFKTYKFHLSVQSSSRSISNTFSIKSELRTIIYLTNRQQ
jgi:hypothetical protein